MIHERGASAGGSAFPEDVHSVADVDLTASGRRARTRAPSTTTVAPSPMGEREYRTVEFTPAAR